MHRIKNNSYICSEKQKPIIINILTQNTMNKTELVNAMAEKTGMTKVAAKAAMNACFTTIQEQLSKGQKVSLIGFGTFSVVERKARTAKNPQTGEKVKVPAKKVAKFKAGSNLLAKKAAKKAAKKK